jgi:splicing factor 1
MFDENVASIQEEELLDRRNLLKNIHPLMKLWYNSAPIVTVKEKYGPFPSFWQDLESWEHLKILKKLYLKVTERSESGLEVDVCALEKILADESSVATTTVNEESNENGDADKSVKKRRNRWGAAPAVVTDSATTATDVTSITAATSSVEVEVDSDAKKSRRSRWSTADVTIVPTLPLIMPLSQEVVQQTMVLKVQLEQIGQRLVTVAQDAARISLDPSRSPSPPPRYDGSGKRSNTRDVRMKEELMEQRGKIIEELMKINPQFQPPSDFVRTKPFKRLMIPFREFPTYNFIGLIIGPRGNTQKELEQATGCKISIRGKGSSKEGSKGRSSKNVDDDEELHVHVTADDAAKVEEAAKLIAAFLNPIDDDKNDHKQKQLKELVSPHIN